MSSKVEVELDIIKAVEIAASVVGIERELELVAISVIVEASKLNTKLIESDKILVKIDPAIKELKVGWTTIELPELGANESWTPELEVEIAIGWEVIEASVSSNSEVKLDIVDDGESINELNINVELEAAIETLKLCIVLIDEDAKAVELAVGWKLEGGVVDRIWVFGVWGVSCVFDRIVVVEIWELNVREFPWAVVRYVVDESSTLSVWDAPCNVVPGRTKVDETELSNRNVDKVRTFCTVVEIAAKYVWLAVTETIGG